MNKLERVTAGCSKNNITMILTAMLRFMSKKYLFETKYSTTQTKMYVNIIKIGSINIKKTLKIIEFGANAFISLSFIKQSIDTKASDDEPSIFAGTNMSVIVSGELELSASVVEITCK